MQAEEYIIKWGEVDIGYFIDPMPDMFYLEGKLKLFDSHEAGDFKALAERLKPSEVLKNPIKGTRITIRSAENPKPINCLVCSLIKNELFVRRINDQESIQWLIGNVD